MLKGIVRVVEEQQLERLSRLAQPVEKLYYLGNFPELLRTPLVAIVGSRKVSSYGRAATVQLASALAKAGVTIVSGLALGVDSIAHKAAVDAGGKTIAVLPCDLNRVYPASHYGLARQIVKQGGALVSEYAPGFGAPMKHQFIARNRIIAALSQGVLLTEAAAKSGSLHTANFAIEEGIEVFAVPGNITSSTSEGTNGLIKSGAHPVTRAGDILEILDINITNTAQYTPRNNSEAEVLRHLLSTGGNSKEMLRLSGLTASHFQQTLTILEIQGTIQQVGQGIWAMV